MLGQRGTCCLLKPQPWDRGHLDPPFANGAWCQNVWSYCAEGEGGQFFWQASAPVETPRLTSGQKDRFRWPTIHTCFENTEKSEEIQQTEVNQKQSPGGPVDKNPSANAGHTGSTPGLGGSHRPGASTCAATAEARAPWSLGTAKKASPTLQLESPLTTARSQPNPK